MKIRNLFALVGLLSLLSFASVAKAENSWKNRVGSNSFSDQERGADSPDMVEMPPNGFPSAAMSVEDSGGNGMAKRDHFDIYSHESAMPQSTHYGRAEMRHHMSGDDVVIQHSAAPAEHAFAIYGEDIPALRGLQLETALNRLHHINQSEISMAKLAETRSKSEDVLHLAHRIRADHEALEKQVVALASRRNVTLKTFQLATYEKAMRDRLYKLEGAKFEAAFLRVNERGNEEAAWSLRAVRNSLADSEVRGLINEALPQMAAHRLLPSESLKARASSEGGDLGE